MPTVERADARLHVEVEGSGYPVFVIAPGGLRSANELWSRAPWNPRERLAGDYQLIGMDQRNAGRSVGAVRAEHDWSTYRDDQLAVLDDLGIERCHVIGMCIGGAFVAGLITAQPDRFSAAVMLQPVGIDGNRETFYELADSWWADTRESHPDTSESEFSAFRSNMWDGEFVLAATRDQIAACRVPLLVALGNDEYHPSATSRDIVAAAPSARLLERWKDDESLPATHDAITEFLAVHTPAS